MKRSVLLCVLALLATLRVALADSEIVAITHAVIHPATGPAIVNGTLVVRDGRILSVGTGPAPGGARVVDAGGGHVYPSLIDPDTTLGLLEIEAVRATRDAREIGRMNASVRTEQAFNPDSQLLPVAMSAGILVAGVAPRGRLVQGRSAVMMLAGWTREDMTVKAPAALYVKWPQMGVARFPWSRPAKKQEKERREALREIDEAFENARAYEKAVGAGKTEEQDVQWEAMNAALRGEIPVVVAAEGVDEIRAALKWTSKQKVRAILLGARDGWRIAREIALARVPVIYTGVLTIPDRDHESYDACYAAPSVLVAAGVPVALSVGDPSSNVRYLADVAARAHAYGLSDLAALQAVTLRPAELLGVSDRLGSLTVGKDATFFLADGDILDMRTHVLRAWVRGKEVDLTDRQKKLWERYRNRPSAPP